MVERARSSSTSYIYKWVTKRTVGKIDERVRNIRYKFEAKYMKLTAKVTSSIARSGAKV